MAYIEYADGGSRPVKNLGWLLRHSAEVESLAWASYAPEARWTNGGMQGLFSAYMRNGNVYRTSYASFQVWKSFINRPVFRGVECNVNGITGEI